MDEVSLVLIHVRSTGAELISRQQAENLVLHVLNWVERQGLQMTAGIEGCRHEDGPIDPLARPEVSATNVDPGEAWHIQAVIEELGARRADLVTSIEAWCADHGLEVSTLVRPMTESDWSWIDPHGSR